MKYIHRSLFILFIAYCIYFFPLLAYADIEIHFLDVGQGDSAIILCDGKAMMIDGGEPSESQFIFSYLRNTLQIQHIDYIVSTHPHSDHVGGLSAAINACSVDVVFSPVFFYEDSAFLSFRKEMQKHNLSFTVPIPGNTLHLGNATVEFLAPSKLHSKMNDNSIILRVLYGEVSFLFMGDAEVDEEQELLSSNSELSSTLIKIGHHGSNTSSSPGFLSRVSPSFAVISVGKDNKYGHPASDTIDTLANMDVTILRTDMSGTIICISDGHNLSYSTEKKYQEGRSLSLIATEDEDISDIVSRSNSQESAEDAVFYIGNKKSRKFHYPTCQGVIDMKKDNRIDFYSREDAISLGYEPCGTCKP